MFYNFSITNANHLEGICNCYMCMNLQYIRLTYLVPITVKVTS